MTDLDLHALANSPGAGKAQQALKVAGNWNQDYAADGSLNPEWDIEVTATATVHNTLTVRAPDAETALRLAREDAPEEDEDAWTTDMGTLSVQSARVITDPT